MKKAVDYMKKLNISFNSVNEEDAVQIIKTEFSCNTLMEYAGLFERYSCVERKGQFINLDFGVLYNLALLDLRLCKIIVGMSIELEQCIKMILLSDCEEVGYANDVVRDFISTDEKRLSSLYEQLDISAQRILNGRALNELSLEVLLEIIPFGTLQQLINFFYKRFSPQIYGKEQAPFEPFLGSARVIRNASAHNNPLIGQLSPDFYAAICFPKNSQLITFLYNNGVAKRTLSTNMSKPIMHDISCFLYLYFQYVPSLQKKEAIVELYNFVDVHCKKNVAYYVKNPTLVSAYKFFHTVLDIYDKEFC